MDISEIYNTNNVSMHGAKISVRSVKRFVNSTKQKVLDTFNEKTLSESKNKEKMLNKINKIISRPDVNRFIMGVTAILTQPWIDLYNPRVDEETRKVSMHRTIAKIIAGCCVGMAVRGGCYNLVKKMTKPDSVKKIDKCLLPKNNEQFYEALKKDKDAVLSNYQNSLSTCIAILVMLFTNFMLDAPLTTYLTNKLNARALQKSARENGKEALNG